MLDLAHLFKILLAITRENDYFLVAQDAFIILKSVLDQMRGLEQVIADYSDTVVKLCSEEGNEEESQQYEQKIVVFKELLEKRPLWDSIMSKLMLQAKCFWFCGPVDAINPSENSRKSIENWRIYHEHREEIGDDVKEQIDQFKSSCMKIVRENFADLLADVLEQERAEFCARKSLPSTDIKNASFIPIGCRGDFDATNNSVFVVCTYPLTHFSIPDPKFAKLLGYSVARILTVPFLSFIVNSGETNDVVNKIQKMESPLTAQIYYRSVTRSVVAVRWEICSKPVAGHLMCRGIDVTKVMEACRGDSVSGTEKILRNWLHSIRNASFQQQAEMIQEDVNAIWNKMETDKDELAEDFSNLTNSIKTLIYTSRASVGLIDQALSCQDMMNSTEVSEFVHAISTFAANFAKSEGMGNSEENSFKLFLDGERSVESRVHEGLMVRGDLSTLTTLINNIYSNAVRYTDPEKGVSAALHIHIHAMSVQFMLTIEDWGGGLPVHIVRFYQDKISTQKITDLRDKKNLKESQGSTSAPNSPTVRSVSPSFSENIPANGALKHLTRKSDRSSLTGIPHIVDMYHELTEAGANDFDMSVVVKSSGTKYTLTFAYDIIVPTRVSLPCKKEKKLTYSFSDRKLLIVDDSHVVRRILERYLTTLEVPYQSFPDGLHAYEWYKTNYSACMGVITDLEMPKMGGFALINNIKKITPNVPCYIISGNNIAAENFPSNVLGALVKPVAMENLRTVVKLLIAEDMKNQEKGKTEEKCSLPSHVTAVKEV